MNTNEQQWQECPLEEATHARTATGGVYELDDDKEIVIKRAPVRGMTFIHSQDFPAFGIIPVRKAEVKPVEFVGEVWGVSFDGNYTEVTIRVTGNVGGEHGKDLIGRNVKVEVQP